VVSRSGCLPASSNVMARAARRLAIPTRRVVARQVVASLLEELAARGGLAAGLGGRDAAGLAPLLRHVARYITEPRCAGMGMGWGVMCGMHTVKAGARVRDGGCTRQGAGIAVSTCAAALVRRTRVTFASRSAPCGFGGGREPGARRGPAAPARRYTRLLSGVAHRLLDAYSAVVGESGEVDKLLLGLQDRLAEELVLQVRASCAVFLYRGGAPRGPCTRRGGSCA
jgi:hypothetical protein